MAADVLACIARPSGTHYSDAIMDAMASQITSPTIVYSIVYSGADQRKHQSSASLAFVRGIHRWPVNSPHKWPVTRKMFSLDDGTMHGHLPMLPCATRKDFNYLCHFGVTVRGVVENAPPRWCMLMMMIWWWRIWWWWWWWWWYDDEEEYDDDMMMMMMTTTTMMILMFIKQIRTWRVKCEIAHPVWALSPFITITDMVTDDLMMVLSKSINQYRFDNKATNQVYMYSSYRKTSNMKRT